MVFVGCTSSIGGEIKSIMECGWCTSSRAGVGRHATVGKEGELGASIHEKGIVLTYVEGENKELEVELLNI